MLPNPSIFSNNIQDSEEQDSRNIFHTMRLIYLLVPLAVLGVALALPKEPMKKTFKTRSDLVANDTSIVASHTTDQAHNATTAEKEKESEQEDKSKETQAGHENKGPVGHETSHSAPEPSKDKEPALYDETPALELPKPTYLTRMKMMLKRVMEVFGLPMTRKSRKMRQDHSMDGAEFVEDMKRAYGALTGRGKRECVKRAACSAGTYLRQVKGKELLIVLLEKFAPDFLLEPVNHIKEAAIYKDVCDYTCEVDP